jgi:glycine betaine/proline transport system substrate-binding protein
MNLATKKLTVASVLASLLVSLIACQPAPQTPTPSVDSSKAQKETALPGKGVKVRPAYDILEQLFIAEIFNMALEKLGYEVAELKQINSAALMYTAVANSDIDFTPLDWEKLYQELYEKNGGEKKLERVGAIADNLVQGYQIDKKTADAYKITNLGQLKDPKIAKLFDSDGDGKANFVGPPAGFGVDEVMQHHINAYGLRDTVEIDQGNYIALMTDVITRYKQGKPVLYFTWVPSWTNAVLKPGQDTIWLAVPFTSMPEKMGKFTEKDTSLNGKNYGFAVDRMRVLANKKFLETNPAAKRLFELIQIPVADLNAQQGLFQKGENTPEKIHRQAEDWIKNHQPLFDSWIKEAKRAGKAS